MGGNVFPWTRLPSQKYGYSFRRPGSLHGETSAGFSEAEQNGAAAKQIDFVGFGTVVFLAKEHTSHCVNEFFLPVQSL